MPAPRKLDPTASVASLLGSKVRRLREARGWTQAELGFTVHASNTRIAKIELGTDPPTPVMAAALDEALQAEGQLLELLPFLEQQPYEDWASTFLRRQAEASAIHECGQAVPGLLQTEEYARAMLSAGQVLHERDVDSALRARMERQSVLDQERPPWLWIVLGEAAIRNVIGGPGVMRAQLLRLLEVGSFERVHVQMLPFANTDPAVLGGSMTLLSFRNGEKVAYTEGIHSGKYMEEPEEVARYSALYDRLQANALDPSTSAALIRQVLEEHYP
ncbi:helix-turn-helix transcriptional regulator [Streptomyces albiaxialis]|uniref:Helix-turn-helix transcriptional regulator n=1 Tax=Streptomyces albiaxialis TaxID=329523 RepID=A0ABN2W0Z4_9ACTN